MGIRKQTATTGVITGNILQITEVVHDTSRGAHESATAAGRYYLRRISTAFQSIFLKNASI